MKGRRKGRRWGGLEKVIVEKDLLAAGFGGRLGVERMMGLCVRRPGFWGAGLRMRMSYISTTACEMKGTSPLPEKA